MKTIIFTTLLSIGLFAEHKHTAIADQHFSPQVGADNLTLALQLAEDSRLFNLNYPFLSKTPALGRVARFSELFLFWQPMNYASMVTQHEVFGHGYRIRALDDVGASVTKYKIDLPLLMDKVADLQPSMLTPLNCLFSNTPVFQLEALKQPQF